MEKEIEKLALHNAIKYEGKANPGAVLGHLFGENPKLKEKATEISQKVQAFVKQVNAMSLDDQIARLKKIAPELLEEKKAKKKKELPSLPNVHGTVVTRIPPEPSKYPHFGHALSFLLNYLYAKKYNGKCILRIDDTNPEKAKKEYYDALYDALLWLRISPDDTIIASKEMETFYQYAEQLIEKEVAYVCFCDRETMSHHRTKSMICDHREQSVSHTMDEWKKMLAGKYKPGEATLRLRGDMDAANAVMRDPVLFRVSTASHPLVKDKYKVWPMYDFESAVAEEMCGVTHILRSIEFGTMRIELQDYIKKILGLKKQEVVQYGRFSIQGYETQGRVIREMIEKNEVQGWDDPRLATIMALRRRGIVPDTFYELCVEVGLSTTATNLDWSVVASVNRRLIDPTTRRFFFVRNPKKVHIEHRLRDVDVPNHPENKELGTRKMRLGHNFYVQDDIDPLKVYRFMHLFNFIGEKFLSEEYDASIGAKIIHAVPVDDAIDVKVLMADGSILEGKGEAALAELNEGDIVQFERQFFCRLDNRENMLFVYAHD